jgi:hypothetical protein
MMRYIVVSIDVISVVAIHLCLTGEILLILYCFNEFDFIDANIEEREHQEYETFVEERIQIKTISNVIDINTSPLVRVVDNASKIIRYNRIQ